MKKVLKGALVIFSVGTLASWARVYLLRTSQERIAKRMRNEAFSNLVRQEIEFFDSEVNAGKLVSILGEDVQCASEILTENMAFGLRGLSSTVNGTIMLLSLSPKLTVVSIGVIPFIGLTAILFVGSVRRKCERFREAQDEASAFISERVSNITTVKQFGQEELESNQFFEKAEKTFQAGKDVAIADGRFRGFLSLGINVSLLSVMLAGGWLVGKNELTLGKLTSFVIYSGMVGLGTSSLSSCYSEISKALTSASRIFNLIDRKPKMSYMEGIVPSEENRAESDAKPLLEFSQVNFVYPSRPDSLVLKNISFSIRKGEVICLVGKSGSGKSTLASLITRIYDCTSGILNYQGRDIRELNLSWYRRQFSVVAQEPVLFNFSILQNILYGSTERQSNETALEAAKHAHVDEFMNSFPEKEKTIAGERGSLLSGGQKQRIAIARAILKNSPVLILDEATSFLDNQSRNLVIDALKNLISSGKTVLVIAHRSWPLQYANRIIVLEKGEIIANGSLNEITSGNAIGLDPQRAAAIVQEMQDSE
jgi:ATP-binding cassette subfamily B (MDR/TAP) protein 10